MPQKQYVSHYDNLKDKWGDQNRQLQKNLWEKHKDTFEWIGNQAKKTAVGSAAAFMLFAVSAPATSSAALAQEITPKSQYITNLDKKVFLVNDLSHILPDKIEPLTYSQEDVISQTLMRHFTIPITPVLQDKRMNVSYGYIGAEQHLMRYPGDVMETHFDTQEDAEMFTSSGMAPGRGAWGYFAQSPSSMTQEDILREKYYVAVQTFLSNGYNQRVKEYSDFFKYRKVIVVNPENGKAIIADIADSGPGTGIGKQFGGSPEVMHYLERVDGAQKGPVLIFFVDDPDNEIALGPIQTQ